MSGFVKLWWVDDRFLTRKEYGAELAGRPGESGLHLFSKNVYLSVIKSKSQ